MNAIYVYKYWHFLLMIYVITNKGTYVTLLNTFILYYMADYEVMHIFLNHCNNKFH